jgi:hypothetical protein
MRKHTHRKNERGAALAVVGICMVLLVSMAAVGVDLGRLALTANEAQVLADVGAAAGAKALLDRRFSDPSVDPETVPFDSCDEFSGEAQDMSWRLHFRIWQEINDLFCHSSD